MDLLVEKFIAGEQHDTKCSYIKLKIFFKSDFSGWRELLRPKILIVLVGVNLISFIGSLWLTNGKQNTYHFEEMTAKRTCNPILE